MLEQKQHVGFVHLIFDLPKILQEITLDDVLEAGHRLIDDGDLIDFTIFPS